MEKIIQCIIRNPAESLGYREKEVLFHLKAVEKLNEPGRNIYRFKSVNGNTFEFDKDRQTVTG